MHPGASVFPDGAGSQGLGRAEAVIGDLHAPQLRHAEFHVG